MGKIISNSNFNEADLFKLQNPKQLFHKIQLFSGIDQFIFDQRFVKAREAWIISRFCIGYEELVYTKCEVKMSKDEPADANVRINNEIIDYQITESLAPGRKRNIEYKDWINRGKPLEPKLYRPMDFDKAAGLVKKAILNKINKNYSVKHKTNLLVYVDFDRNDLYLDKLHEKCIDINIAPFDEVWLFVSTFVNDRSGYAIAKLMPAVLGFYPYVIDGD